MTPAEPQSPERARLDSSDQPQRRTTQAQWTLTQEALENLLACLSPDRDEAAKQYVTLEMKIVRYFEKEKIAAAETRADDVLNRVARKVAEGKQIENVTAYAYRVAYLVFLEAGKEPDHVEIDPEQGPHTTAEPVFEDSEPDRRQNCFDSCLEKLTVDNRELILGYYQEDGREKIEFRKWLAARLKISLDALRIRAHRIRKNLEECIAECLGQPV
jgi:DNA-directed RNA polymerase specialized sigma24 family protein